MELDYINEGFRKLTNNFYLLVRKKKYWTKNQIKVIKKYLNYKLFYPVPKPFVELAIFGYNDEDFSFYEKPCPKYIMFNFDYQNKKRQSLRGVTVVSINGTKNNDKYFTIDLIGNYSVKSSIIHQVKKRSSSSVKNGKDMIEWWKTFGRYSCFKYCKLDAMEDVIGFYWKCGWRFGENFKYYKKKESRISKHVEKLNNINIKIKNCNVKTITHLDFERDQILRSYFDKYIEGYYSDVKLNQYSQYNEDFENYNIKSTSHLIHHNMRYHGYPMYLDCSPT